MKKFLLTYEGCDLELGSTQVEGSVLANHNSYRCDRDRLITATYLKVLEDTTFTQIKIARIISYLIELNLPQVYEDKTALWWYTLYWENYVVVPRGRCLNVKILLLMRISPKYSICILRKI